MTQWPWPCLNQQCIVQRASHYTTVPPLQYSSDMCELHIPVVYACILSIRVCQCMHIRAYIHTCLFVMYSHKFLYEALLVKQKDIIFMGMKRASKRNLHIVKASYRSMKAIIFWVFDHFANSPTNYHFSDTFLILSYQKREKIETAL